MDNFDFFESQFECPVCKSDKVVPPVGSKESRAPGVVYPAGPGMRTAITVAVGGVAWAAFAFALHRPLIGVAPFG